MPPIDSPDRDDGRPETIDTPPRDAVSRQRRDHRMLYHVHLAPHRTGADARGFARHARGAAAIVLESFGHEPAEAAFFDDEEDTPATADVLARCGRGEISAKEAMRLLGSRDPFQRRQLQAVSRSAPVPVIVSDCQAEDALTGELLGLDIWQQRLLTEFDGTFEERLASVDALLRNEALLENRRERMVVEGLLSQVDALIDRGILDGRAQLRTLIHYGSCHTGIPRLLRQSGRDVRVTLNRLPHVFPYHDEAVRAAASGRPLSDDLVARAWVELLCVHLDAVAERQGVAGEPLLPPIEDTARQAAGLRFAIAHLESEDIHALYEDCRERPDATGDAVRRAFAQRGIRIPRSAAEIDAVIAGFVPMGR